VLSPNSPNFSIIEVNEAYLQLKKLSRTQVIGKDLLSLFAHNPSYDLTEWRNSLDQVLSQKKNIKVTSRQYEIICPETGKVEIKYLEIDSIPIFNEEGKVIYIVRLITDH